MKKRNYIATITLTVTLCLTYLLSGCTRDNDIDIPQTSVNMMEATTVHKSGKTRRAA